MRISDWSSDVCSSDLHDLAQGIADAVRARGDRDVGLRVFLDEALAADLQAHRRLARRLAVQHPIVAGYGDVVVRVALGVVRELLGFGRCIELKSIAVLHVGRRGDLERVVERRSEERRVEKECVSTCRSRWSASHSKKKK